MYREASGAIYFMLPHVPRNEASRSSPLMSPALSAMPKMMTEDMFVAPTHEFARLSIFWAIFCCFESSRPVTSSFWP